MKIHLIRFFCFTVLLCLYFCHITCAEDSSLIQVEVKGSGKTRQQAIKNAKHNAVEQVMGVYIKSDTEISMGLVVKNDVSSRTEGYIENYEIIAEAPDPINVYIVQLSATINKKKIQYDIEKIYQKDPEELVQFVKNKFFSRSLMVYYQVVDDQDIQNNLSMAVKTLINQIQDELVDYGFRIILQTERARIRKQVIEKTFDKLTAIEYAKQEMSDAVITVNYELLQEKTPDEYLQIFGTASLRCFDVSTGELFANVEHSNTTLSEQSLFYVRKTTKDLTKKIAKKVVKKLITKLVHRFSKTRQNSTMLIIKDISAQTQEQVEKMLENIGWDYRMTLYIRAIMELEIFSESSTTNIQNKFYKECKKRNMLLYHIESKGSRILFSGKRN